MNNLSGLNKIIKYIEDNLCSDIDIGMLARSVNMSLYEFRRVFSFAAGIPISEYIRKRRMSRAAEDLLAKNTSVTALAAKYGYDAPSSFSRAFKEFHGCGPNEIMQRGHSVKMFTPLSFEIFVGGGTDYSYSISDEEGFSVCGFWAKSEMSDTECCEDVWSAFYESAISEEVIAAAKDRIYAVYINGENGVECVIGAKNCKNAKCRSVFVPASKWLSFKVRGADDEKVNRAYKDILYSCLPSSSYDRNYDMPNIEIFPEDMESPDFEWEIRIPVNRKAENENE